MINQVREQIKNTISQIQENTANPQELFASVQEKNKALAEDIQQIVLSAPQKISDYLQNQQERITHLNQNINNVINRQPIDIQQLAHTWYQFNTEQFNTHLDMAREYTSSMQEIFTHYASPVVQNLKNK